MPRWKEPEPKWYGEDVYIIGGGPSLKGFYWSLLKDKLTIGCNDAYRLGVKVCKICFFGDHKWFLAHQSELEAYAKDGGIVFTNCVQLQHSKVKWLWIMERQSRGLHKNALGWNGHTGASAINLALVLGAKRVYLLGFDMHLSKDKESNWHPNNLDKPDSKVYKLFLGDFGRIVRDLKKKFPGREILNITSDSSLNAFQKIDVDLFWEGQMK